MASIGVATSLQTITRDGLLFLAPKMTAADIDLVISVAIRNKRAVPGYEVLIEVDVIAHSFNEVGPLSKREFHAQLSARRGVLRELIRSLPEVELVRAFEMGAEKYRQEGRSA